MTDAAEKQIDWAALFDEQSEKLEAFRLFHKQNPHVARELARRAQALVDRGHKRVGINMLFEVLRWSHMVRTRTDEPFKLNNNYAPYYSRLVERLYPQLEGVFTRRRAAADSEGV